MTVYQCFISSFFLVCTTVEILTDAQGYIKWTSPDHWDEEDMLLAIHVSRSPAHLASPEDLRLPAQALLDFRAEWYAEKLATSRQVQLSMWDTKRQAGRWVFSDFKNSKNGI